ncbi:MAG: flagellar M-ring protein FliF, partial [Coriobacteriia bacterium]|nr:flagellar M-ring protein FliF [Coriobacteriia bacterium]
MEQFTKFGPIQAITRFWGTLSNTQRFVTAVFMAASLALLLVVSVVATRPKMEVLFSGLESNDAGTIVSKLQEKNIPYELTNGGSVVKVPEKDVHEMRLLMATEGLPQGGTVGFEIFDKSSFGLTSFTQRVSYQRALQGELSRTIGQLDLVDTARVHLTIPEKKLFDRSNSRSTASVVLKLRAGSDLGSEQVAGIVHLVSAAVEGLDSKNVSVVDTAGNVLSEPTDDATGADPRLSASQLALRRGYEQQAQKDLQSMLERVLGPNKAVVRVSAKMNFDRTETDSEIYQPGGAGRGILASEEATQESYGSGPGGTPSGVPTGAKGNGYTRVETNSKYQVSKTTEHVVRSPGYVEQVSVAVMLDQKVDAAKIPAVRNAVQAAVGADPTRGDKVIVESVPFDNSAVEKEDKALQAAASRDTIFSVLKTVGGILLLFGFLFMLSRMLRKV